MNEYNRPPIEIEYQRGQARPGNNLGDLQICINTLIGIANNRSCPEVEIRWAALGTTGGSCNFNLGRIPVILLDIYLPVTIVPTVLAHELAHVLIEKGVGCLAHEVIDHGASFKNMFLAIRKEFEIRNRSGFHIQENGWKPFLTLDGEKEREA